jgi:hypothetical protein
MATLREAERADPRELIAMATGRFFFAALLTLTRRFETRMPKWQKSTTNTLDGW